MFIPDAFAQAAAPSQGGGASSIIMLVLLFAVFYFLLIRPQNKKLKAHQNMVASLKRNDKVQTTGGIIGTITKVHADSKLIDVKIADNTEVTMVRDAVIDVMNRGVVADTSALAKAETAKKGKK